MTAELYEAARAARVQARDADEVVAHLEHRHAEAKAAVAELRSQLTAARKAARAAATAADDAEAAAAPPPGGVVTARAGAARAIAYTT